MRRIRTHVGRRAPTESSRKHHRRARRQLTKLVEALGAIQRQVLTNGVSKDRLAQIEAALEPLDEVLRAARSSETRTRVYKRIRKAAKQARHAIS